jgi:hypothetical protein
MTNLSGIKKGHKVFIFMSNDPDSMLGVEVMHSFPDAETAEVKIVYTNGIPGYEVGQRLVLPGESPAYSDLTVDAILALESQQ